MTSNYTFREDYNKDLKNRDDGLVIFESFTMSLIHLLTAVGNVLFCLVIFKTPVLQNKTNLYVAALALSDIIKAIIVMPLTLATLIMGEWIFGYTMCQIQGFTILLSTFGALQTVSLIALNRYYCVVKPSKYRKIFQIKYCIWMLIAVYMASFIAAIAPLASQVGFFMFRGERSCCWVTIPDFVPNITYTVSCLLFFILWPFGVIIVSYTKVFRKLRNHAKELASRQAHLSMGGVSAREVRVTKQLFILVLGFGACWIPCIVLELVDTFLPGGALPRGTYMLYIYLGYISSAINPILYGILNRSFREAFLNVFCCKDIDIHPTSAFATRE